MYFILRLIVGLNFGLFILGDGLAASRWQRVVAVAIDRGVQIEETGGSAWAYRSGDLGASVAQGSTDRAVRGGSLSKRQQCAHQSAIRRRPKWWHPSIIADRGHRQNTRGAATSRCRRPVHHVHHQRSMILS